MRTRTYSDAVQCDSCGRVAIDPCGWLTLRAHFVLDRASRPNGFINDDINRQAYDLCSMRCAKRKREALLTIVRLAP